MHHPLTHTHTHNIQVKQQMLMSICSVPKAGCFCNTTYAGLISYELCHAPCLYVCVCMRFSVYGLALMAALVAWAFLIRTPVAL